LGLQPVQAPADGGGIDAQLRRRAAQRAGLDHGQQRHPAIPIFHVATSRPCKNAASTRHLSAGIGGAALYLRMREQMPQEETIMNAIMPQTLLQMRGLAIAPARLSQSALVIIDAQGEYRSGRMALPGIDPALARIADLLARARAAGTPLFHVAQVGQTATLFAPRSE